MVSPRVILASPIQRDDEVTDGLCLVLEAGVDKEMLGRSGADVESSQVPNQT